MSESQDVKESKMSDTPERELTEAEKSDRFQDLFRTYRNQVRNNTNVANTNINNVTARKSPVRARKSPPRPRTRRRRVSRKPKQSKEAHKKKIKEWREKNREHLKAYSRNYRETKLNELDRARHIENNFPIYYRPEHLEVDYNKVFDNTDDGNNIPMLTGSPVKEDAYTKSPMKEDAVHPLDEEELDFDDIPMYDDGHPRGGKKKTQRGCKRRGCKSRKTRKSKK